MLPLHLLAAVLVALPLSAQIDRHELSLRLRAAEHQLALVVDPAHRKAGFAHFEEAVAGFFAFNLASTAKALSLAELAMAGTTPDPDVLFAHALALRPKWRLVDAECKALPIELDLALDRFGERPGDLRFSAWIADEPMPTGQIVGDLPAALEIRLPDLPEGDHVLHWRLSAGDRPLLTRQQAISVVTNASERLDRVAAAAQTSGENDLDAATLQLLSGMLQSMRTGKREETSFPGAVLLHEAEALAATRQRRTTCAELAMPGQHWIAVPLQRRPQVARIAVPARANADERLPVVIALHGAGGSENMFFDAYGNGGLVQACVARGWLVIAPRCPLLGSVDLQALLDAMATRWPIDRQRVALVGHSMGAMQSIAAVVEKGASYRAVAALGGGGRVPKGTRIDVPSFVGVGSRDFARSNAIQLHESLRRAGSKSELREFPDVEHLTVVQIATPEVVAFLAAALAPPPR